MYITKLNFESWIDDINYIRVWLFIECIFFFTWIIASSIFVAISYISKLKPTNKNEAIMLLDDNVWNDKSSDDFLRYIKFDYYIFTAILTNLMVEIMIGFTNLDHLDLMGKRDNHVTTIFALMIISRVG